MSEWPTVPYQIPFVPAADVIERLKNDADLASQRRTVRRLSPESAAQATRADRHLFRGRALVNIMQPSDVNRGKKWQQIMFDDSWSLLFFDWDTVRWLVPGGLVIFGAGGLYMWGLKSGSAWACLGVGLLWLNLNILFSKED